MLIDVFLGQGRDYWQLGLVRVTSSTWMVAGHGFNRRQQWVGEREPEREREERESGGGKRGERKKKKVSSF